MQFNFENLLNIVGQIFFLFLFYLAHTFYLERLINSDSAYYIMELIYHQNYFFPHSRYINLLPQTLPLLGIISKASLDTILWLYSISFMLIYGLCFNWVSYGLKNKAGAFLLVLAMCLGFRYKMFVCISESTITFFFLALFIAWWTSLKRQQTKWYKWVITSILLLIIWSGHPIILIPFLIFLGYDTIFHNRYFDLDQWKLLILSMAGYLLRFTIVAQNGYESGKMSVLKNSLDIKIWDYPIFDLILEYFKYELIFPIIAFIIFSIYWIKKGKGLSILFLIISAIGFLGIIAVTMSTLTQPIRNIIDGYIGIWALVIALPIYYYLNEAIRNTKYILLTITLVIVCTFQIWNKHTFFENRLATIQNLINENTNETQRKAMVQQGKFPYEQLWYNWGIGLETLLLSSAKSAENSATVYVYDNQKQAEENNKRDIFLCTPWAIHEFNQNNLPKKYFDLPKQKYTEGKRVW